MFNIYDYNLSVANVFHIELLAASSQTTREFDEVIENSLEEIAAALGVNEDLWNTEDMSTLEIQNSLLDMNLSGFLISFKTRLPHNFKFSESGEILSYSESCSLLTEYFHGQTVEECTQKAIAWRKELVARNAEEARQSA